MNADAWSTSDEQQQGIEASLRRAIEAANLPVDLREAALYAALSPGKRLRPILTLSTCALVGGDAERALSPATAVEMIHAFSLVHDDLPAMDDDDLRRGLPTVHVKFGEPLAILTGDLLSSLAFATIVQGSPDPAIAARLTGELAQATNAMIAGQVYDTFGSFPPGLSDAQRLELIHRNKTGALIRCACRLGAICGGANDEELATITAYAEALGLMFQIVDDILDVTQTAREMGKRTGKDLEAGKLTYPGLLGLDAARAEVARLEAEAEALLEPWDESAQALRELCHRLAVRTT
jgi:geranylgeranyl diphosphate synthase, type II